MNKAVRATPAVASTVPRPSTLLMDSQFDSSPPENRMNASANDPM